MVEVGNCDRAQSPEHGIGNTSCVEYCLCFCNAPNSRHASVSWVVISTLQLYMQIGLQGRKNT